MSERAFARSLTSGWCTRDAAPEGRLAAKLPLRAGIHARDDAREGDQISSQKMCALAKSGEFAALPPRALYSERHEGYDNF